MVCKQYGVEFECYLVSSPGVNDDSLACSVAINYCTHLMYPTLHLFIVGLINCVASAVSAIIAVYGEWVSLAIVALGSMNISNSDILFHFL